MDARTEALSNHPMTQNMRFHRHFRQRTIATVRAFVPYQRRMPFTWFHDHISVHIVNIRLGTRCREDPITRTLPFICDPPGTDDASGWMSKWLIWTGVLVLIASSVSNGVPRVLVVGAPILIFVVTPLMQFVPQLPPRQSDSFRS